MSEGCWRHRLHQCPSAFSVMTFCWCIWNVCLSPPCTCLYKGNGYKTESRLTRTLGWIYIIAAKTPTLYVQCLLLVPGFRTVELPRVGQQSLQGVHTGYAQTLAATPRHKGLQVFLLWLIWETYLEGSRPTLQVKFTFLKRPEWVMATEDRTEGGRAASRRAWHLAMSCVSEVNQAKGSQANLKTKKEQGFMN